MRENVLILGATSGIARALCQVMGKRGCQLILAGRNLDELNKIAADLCIRYQTKAIVELFEALDFDAHAVFVEHCIRHFNGDLTGVVLCYGYMAEQARAQTDLTVARCTIDTNFTSAVSVLNLVANFLEQRKHGYIVVISSVAGDRGRQSNYIYGASKAGLTIYLQGLRNRLHYAGVHVLTVKPGFVDTPMTHGMMSPNSLLLASPEKVACDIDNAIHKRKNVLYTPWFWWGIMKIVSSVPEFIFKRFKL